MTIKEGTTEWEFFTPKELKCKCGKCSSTGHEMKFELMEKLIFLRRTYGWPMHVSSAYRCPTHNRKVSTTGLIGAHTTGLAVDIRVAGARAFLLLKKAYAMDAFTGIGINQKDDWYSRFIHLDVCDIEKHNRPNIWSY